MDREDIEQAALDLVTDCSKELLALSPMVDLHENLVDRPHGPSSLARTQSSVSRSRSTPYCRTYHETGRLTLIGS